MHSHDGRVLGVCGVAKEMIMMFTVNVVGALDQRASSADLPSRKRLACTKK
jgi:hypothetical protein